MAVISNYLGVKMLWMHYKSVLSLNQKVMFVNQKIQRNCVYSTQFSYYIKGAQKRSLVWVYWYFNAYV